LYANKTLINIRTKVHLDALTYLFKSYLFKTAIKYGYELRYINHYKLFICCFVFCNRSERIYD